MSGSGAGLCHGKDGWWVLIKVIFLSVFLNKIFFVGVAFLFFVFIFGKECLVT